MLEKGLRRVAAFARKKQPGECGKHHGERIPGNCFLKKSSVKPAFFEEKQADCQQKSTDNRKMNEQQMPSPNGFKNDGQPDFFLKNEEEKEEQVEREDDFFHENRQLSGDDFVEKKPGRRAATIVPFRDLAAGKADFQPVGSLFFGQLEVEKTMPVGRLSVG